VGIFSVEYGSCRDHPALALTRSACTHRLYVSHAPKTCKNFLEVIRCARELHSTSCADDEHNSNSSHNAATTTASRA